MPDMSSRADSLPAQKNRIDEKKSEEQLLKSTKAGTMEKPFGTQF